MMIISMLNQKKQTFIQLKKNSPKWKPKRKIIIVKIMKNYLECWEWNLKIECHFFNFPKWKLHIEKEHLFYLTFYNYYKSKRLKNIRKNCSPSSFIQNFERNSILSPTIQWLPLKLNDIQWCTFMIQSITSHFIKYLWDNKSPELNNRQTHLLKRFAFKH